MQYLIDMFGVSVVCIIASVLGGLCNYNVKKAKGKAPRGGHVNWLVERKRARIEVILSVFVAAISAEFFVPPIINQLSLHITFSPAIAFFIGYSGMRLIPMMEQKVSQALDKLG
tara:strand:- start:166 stop:507 length:342 start_codon:yes stop_codon:yes gene_type:complete